MYELVIIGAGPAGLAAGMFAGLYGLKTIVIGEDIGGQANRAPKIFDYPGLEAITGKDWVKAMLGQVRRTGVVVVKERILKIKHKSSKKDYFLISTGDKEYQAKTVILATGNQRRRPDYSGVEVARSLGVALRQEKNAAYIIVDDNLNTNIPGVFAAGDCVIYPLALEQISVASALGIRAAASVYFYLRGEKPPIMWGKASIRRIF